MSVFEDRFRKCTIEHVTLPEGASRAAARSQIDTDTLERIREDVLPALATGVAVAVPGNPDYLLRPLAASEGALAVRLESVAGAELMTIGIGWSDPGASEVWQSMAVATEEPRRKRRHGPPVLGNRTFGLICRPSLSRSSSGASVAGVRAEITPRMPRIGANLSPKRGFSG